MNSAAPHKDARKKVNFQLPKFWEDPGDLLTMILCVIKRYWSQRFGGFSGEPPKISSKTS